MNIARPGVRVLRYSTACVMLQYRSRDIKHKFIIDAVHRRTSAAEWMSHHQLPNTQYPISSFANENGIITRPRKKSATASEAMNQFWMFFSAFSVAIAMMTSIFPTTMTIMRTVTIIEATMIVVSLYPLGYSLWMIVSGVIVDIGANDELNESEKLPPDDALPRRARKSSAVTVKLLKLSSIVWCWWTRVRIELCTLIKTNVLDNVSTWIVEPNSLNN